MANKVQGESKAEMAQNIVKMFKGTIGIKRARKMVEKAKEGESVAIEVKVPHYFRFRNAKGHFTKTK
jgi:hypothetical protein